MSTTIDELTLQVLNLPVAERLLLAGQILRSLPEAVDQHIKEAWLNEAEDRWQSFLAGASKASPADEVIQSIKA